MTVTIVPNTGSVTRPIVETYSASYLTNLSFLQGTQLNVPVWGLYAGKTNTLSFVFNFTDGSIVNLPGLQVTTTPYVDPCPQLNSIKVLTPRPSTSAMSFDYMLVKDYCSSNAPAIIDTDGNLRWVGSVRNYSGTPPPHDTAGSLPAIFVANGIYTSDGGSGLVRQELFGGSRTINYGNLVPGVNTNPHNFDPGRNGSILLDVSTPSSFESAIGEVDTSGNVLNNWDMVLIIGAAMTKGGDNPASFIPDPADQAAEKDWFHINSSVYNPVDNTLIISSRENFVIAVDYDPPADGTVKKIHWILGDKSKKWYTFASLRNFSLTPASGNIVPIGQHAVSIDSKGDLLLFDDGLGSFFQEPGNIPGFPLGVSRTSSVVRSYRIDTVGMTATAIFTYTPKPSIFSGVCSSVYEAAPGDHLVDFAVAGSTLPDPKNPNTFFTSFLTTPTMVVLQGLRGSNVVFDIRYPQATNSCGAGWNAIPILTQPVVFQ